MRVTAVVASFAALALAAPHPQVFDLSDLEDIEPAPAVDVPIGSGSQTLTYNAAAASASVYADVLADPSPDADVVDTSSKRDLTGLEARAACSVQSASKYSYVSRSGETDSAAVFLADSTYSNAAIGATTPSGWVQTFQNLQGSVSTSAYMGYSTYSTYDPSVCAKDCAGKKGCLSFNIFYERDPTLDPAAACPDPASMTVIKCSFWGVPAESQVATNKGQYRNQFQVVIAGSNSYKIAPPTNALAGYQQTLLGDCSIQETCGSYLTVKFLTDGQPYDPSRCAAACAAVSADNLKANPNTGRTCQFFTSYLELKNGVTQYQACALYAAPWDASYCTNKGQGSGVNQRTIQYSYSYTNTTSPGSCAAAAA